MLIASRLLLFCAGVMLPGVGASDRRVPVDAAAPPWRALGRVQTELGSRCTGFLVGARTVLTAAHCLYRRGPGRFVQPGSVHFLLGYDRGRYAAHARAVAFTIGPGYQPDDPTGTLGADWAALTLDAPIGTPDRVLPLAGASASPGAALVLGGYGQDLAERIDADLHCTVTRNEIDRGRRRLIEHGCSGTRGTSGAPLLERRETGWVAIGIEVAAVPGQSLGLAVSAGEVRLPPGWDK